jgi:hypothetical protein
VAINQTDWNVVRNSLGKGEQLYRRITQTVTELNEETGEETSRDIVSYKGVEGGDANAKASFERIEADVERLIQEVTSLQLAERELRSALEEPGGAEIARR